MTCPLQYLEEASNTSPTDSDDLIVIREAISLRFNKDNNDEPIGDELLDAILEFIDRD